MMLFRFPILWLDMHHNKRWTSTIPPLAVSRKDAFDGKYQSNRIMTSRSAVGDKENEAIEMSIQFGFVGCAWVSRRMRQQSENWYLFLVCSYSNQSSNTTKKFPLHAFVFKLMMYETCFAVYSDFVGRKIIATTFNIWWQYSRSLIK